MPEPALNLRPYGTRILGTLENPTWPSDYTTAAHERARLKLDAPPTEAPIARDRRQLWMLAVILAIILLAVARWLEVTADQELPDPELGGAVFWLFLLLYFAGRRLRAWFVSDARSPAGATRTWLAAIHAQQWERVDNLRVAADRDDFPRFLHGRDARQGLPLVTLTELAGYWSELLRGNRLSLAPWMVSRVKVRPIAQGVALVSFRVAIPGAAARVAMLVILLLLAALMAFMILYARSSDGVPIAAFPAGALLLFVGMLVVVSRRRVFDLQKVVVERNGHWRMISGEWQAPEDRKLNWLGNHA